MISNQTKQTIYNMNFFSVLTPFSTNKWFLNGSRILFKFEVLVNIAWFWFLKKKNNKNE